MFVQKDIQVLCLDAKRYNQMLSRYVILALVLLAVSARRKECVAHVPYTQNALSLSWPGDFCHREGNCISDYDTDWDGKSLGIHGLWPSYDSKDLTCVTQGKNPDPFCTYKYYFNEGLLQDLSADLNKYWPQWGVNNYDSFHKNEWNKHGVCYMKLLKEKYGKRYGEDEIFHSYFSTAIALAKQHNTVSKFEFNSKEELAADLNIADPDTFYIACKAGYRQIDMRPILAMGNAVGFSSLQHL